MAKDSTIAEWAKWPAAIIGVLTVLGILMGAFGFGFSTPGDAWNEHNVQHVAEEVIHIEQFDKMDKTLQEIDMRNMEQQVLVESIVRGECIENPIENLQRQGLIAKCEELGIER